MEHKLILFFAALAILVQACTPAASQPTQAAATVTRRPTSTPVPTIEPLPLCGTSVSAEPDAAVTGTLTKFEPPDGYAYFGFTYRLWGDGMPLAEAQPWGDTRPFSERICDSVEFELSGKTPTIIKVHTPWQAADGTLFQFSSTLEQIEQIHTVLGSTVIPFLEWQAQTDTAGGGVELDYAGLTTSDIAAGDFDDYIRQYARDVKTYGEALFIRLICGEFNGNGWQWCSPYANSTLTSADFVNAWRRVVDIFNEEGATNVAWVWTPLPTPVEWGGDPDWQAYYPGDNYVDWVGVNINDWGQPSWMDPFYTFGLEHDKPFFVAEFAIRHEGVPLTHTQQMDWLNEMFDYFESHPQIKAISYFNSTNYAHPLDTSIERVYLYDGQVNYVPNVNDHDQRILAGGPDFRALFLSRIANSRYISTLWASCADPLALPSACNAP